MLKRLVLAALFVGLMFVTLMWQWGPNSDWLSFPKAGASEPERRESSPQPPSAEVHRSPMEVAVTPDGRWLVVVNSTSDSISVVDLNGGHVTQELACGARPKGIAFTPDGKRVLVTSSHGDALEVFQWQEGTLQLAGKVVLRGEPRGIAVAPDGSEAYVALSSVAEIAVVRLSDLAVTDRIAVDAWPRHPAVSSDGKRLAVATNGNRHVSVIDVANRKVMFTESFGGLNAGQMQISPDGNRVYFPWMVYRHNPITDRNIKLGWVLGSRIGYIDMQKPAIRHAITLDVPGLAVADPYGFALSPDGQWIACAAGGTQELLMYRLEGLPFQDVGGPGDHIDRELARDRSRFYRIPLGGRPQGIAYAPDGRKVYVANYLEDVIQEVDLEAREVSRTFALGGPAQPSLARQGEAIFYDARRSLDQWYSCHTCHYEGGVNAVTMDTRNDGSDRTFKTVLSLLNVNHTKPWTWHGWQQDLHASLKKSLTDTMLGPRPTDEDAKALAAFFETLALPPNPHRHADGTLTEAALRGQKIFKGAKAGCSQCHRAPYFCDDQVHDVGQGSDRDVYKGYNTPSLLGVYRRVLLLHHGRAKDFDELLTEYHNPVNVAGEGELTEDERRDLIEYLKSL